MGFFKIVLILKSWNRVQTKENVGLIASMFWGVVYFWVSYDISCTSVFKRKKMQKSIGK